MKVVKHKQMTLGDLIKRLSSMDPELEIKNIDGYLSSYRGIYRCLSIDWETDPEYNYKTTVKKFLEKCKAAVGAEFEGYKGGEYLMTEETPIWLSGYGECSDLQLIDISDDGKTFTVFKWECL